MAQPADHLFTNGKVFTVDPAQPWAEAVAVRGTDIVYVGTDEDARRFVGPATKVADLQGRMMLPGFVSIHEHPLASMVIQAGLVLEPLPNAEAMLTEFDAFATAHPDKRAIFSFGGADVGYVEITRETLDELVPDRPALMIADSGHGGWANSRTLAIAGVTEGAPDPVSHFGRDADGRPTGFIGSAPAVFHTLVALDVVRKEAMLEVYKPVFELFSEFGITAIYEAGVPPGLERPLFETVAEIERRGDLPFRVMASCKVQREDQVISVQSCLREMRGKYHSELFAVNTLKVHGDGIMEGRTAGLLEDYADDPGNRGNVALSDRVMEDLVVAVVAEGFDVHTHAIGDRTARAALDAYEVVRRRGNRDARLSIGHTQLVHDDDMERVADLDVILTTTLIWHVPYELNLDRLGPERYRKMYRFQSLADRGVRVTFGSDFPATGVGVAGLDPLMNIATGLTRSDDGVGILLPESERIRLETAIKGYTIDGAYEIRLQDKVGSIEVGKRADLIVVDRNLFEITPAEIAEATVLLTMMNGRVRHDVSYGWGDDKLVDRSLQVADIEMCHPAEPAGKEGRR